MESKLTILLIDDEPSVLKVLEAFLERRGYNTLTAEKVDSGLAFLKENKAHLVICDVVMPGRDGYQFLESAKKDFSKIPVIMMTGHIDSHTVKMSLQLGADDYISKPIDFAELAQIIERVSWKCFRDRENSNSVPTA